MCLKFAIPKKKEGVKNHHVIGAFLWEAGWVVSLLSVYTCEFPGDKDEITFKNMYPYPN